MTQEQLEKGIELSREIEKIEDFISELNSEKYPDCFLYLKAKRDDEAITGAHIEADKELTDLIVGYYKEKLGYLKNDFANL